MESISFYVLILAKICFPLKDTNKYPANNNNIKPKVCKVKIQFILLFCREKKSQKEKDYLYQAAVSLPLFRLCRIKREHGQSLL